MAHNIACR